MEICIDISIYVYTRSAPRIKKKDFEGFQVYHYHPIGVGIFTNNVRIPPYIMGPYSTWNIIIFSTISKNSTENASGIHSKWLSFTACGSLARVERLGCANWGAWGETAAVFGWCLFGVDKVIPLSNYVYMCIYIYIYIYAVVEKYMAQSLRIGLQEELY